MNALVTGASAGLGLEMARILAARGYHLVLAARRAEPMQALARELPYGATVYPIDLAGPESARELHQRCQQDQLEPDVLVNNAGFGRVCPHVDIDDETVRQMAQLNVVTLSQLCASFGADMRARQSGHILNVASTAAFLPLPYFAEYAATKSYVLNFSLALGWELKQHGVRVSCLCPGPTATEFASVARPQGDLFSREGVMAADEVARLGIEGLFAGDSVVVTGRRNKLIAWLAPLLPRRLVLALAGRHYTSRLADR